jgi:hypothetical protein
VTSAYGKNRGMRCDGCGLCYDDFRTGMTFEQVRRDIIAIKVDRKTGKTKYGRRHGTLGYWHELKMLLWDQHVGECTDAKEMRDGEVKKRKRDAHDERCDRDVPAPGA